MRHANSNDSLRTAYVERRYLKRMHRMYRKADGREVSLKEFARAAADGTLTEVAGCSRERLQPAAKDWLLLRTIKPARADHPKRVKRAKSAVQMKSDRGEKKRGMKRLGKGR
jgi:hypothetical protein